MDYFQILVWPGGGFIGIILWILSIGTLGIIVGYFISIRRESIIPDDVHKQVRDFFEARQYHEAIVLTEAEPSFFSHVVHAGLTEAADGHPAMERAMEEVAQHHTIRLLRHIEWLNLIGNISPMMGLLGTVWGMIHAFFKIVEVGGMPPAEELAGAIGIALVTTLLGLAIAIPALATYSVMRNRIDSLTSEAVVASQNLVASFHRNDENQERSTTI